MFTLTKAELIDAVSPYDDDAIMVACCTWGDRAGTMQAVMLGELTEGFLHATSYSDSGFAVVEQGDESDNDEAVHYFEQGHASHPMTKADLLEALDGLDDEDKIVASCDFGNYNHTQQAIGLDEVSDVYLNANDRSNSGYAVVEEGDENDDALEAVVLNYNAM